MKRNHISKGKEHPSIKKNPKIFFPKESMDMDTDNIIANLNLAN